MTTENEAGKIDIKDVYRIIETAEKLGWIDTETAVKRMEDIEHSQHNFVVSELRKILGPIINNLSTETNSNVVNSARKKSAEEIIRTMLFIDLAIKLAGPEATEEMMKKANEDQQKHTTEDLKGCVNRLLSEYFVRCAKNNEFNADRFFHDLSTFRDQVNDDEIRNNMFEKAFKENALPIFLEANGIQVYDTLIKKFEIERIPEKELDACIKMIDYYVNPMENEYDKNDYLPCIKGLLDYGVPIEYLVGGKRKKSLLAYVLIKEACDNMPHFYINHQANGYQAENNYLKERYNEEFIKKQWALLNLLGDEKYEPDWSFQFPSCACMGAIPPAEDLKPTVYRGIDLHDYPTRDLLEGKNLLTVFIQRSFFHTSLQPILEWVISKSKEQGYDLLNTVDGKGEHVVKLIDEFKNSFKSFAVYTRKKEDELDEFDRKERQYNGDCLEMLDNMRKSFIPHITNQRILEDLHIVRQPTVEIINDSQGQDKAPKQPEATVEIINDSQGQNNAQERPAQPQAEQTNEQPKEPVSVKKGWQTFLDKAKECLPDSVRDFFTKGPHIKS